MLISIFEKLQFFYILSIPFFSICIFLAKMFGFGAFFGGQ